METTENIQEIQILPESESVAPPAGFNPEIFKNWLVDKVLNAWLTGDYPAVLLVKEEYLETATAATVEIGPEQLGQLELPLGQLIKNMEVKAAEQPMVDEKGNEIDAQFITMTQMKSSVINQRLAIDMWVNTSGFVEELTKAGLRLIPNVAELRLAAIISLAVKASLKATPGNFETELKLPKSLKGGGILRK